ncbi:hypothetical protein MNBD_GAMMA18-757 [hydrothermal vent metagenome]|uniref:Cytochrome c domain-containing protein n=1 Tax=hydrothermal vent metagenome TaxID=652676 RepID=A0A3B0ZR31_9ZZZZ
MRFLPLMVLLLVVITTGCSREAGDALTTINAEDRALGKVKSIIIRGGCFGCHDINEHRFGPSWIEVSARYKNDPEATQKLIESVTHGSGGKWSEVVGNNVMAPNNAKVNDVEIAAVVEYILSL